MIGRLIIVMTAALTSTAFAADAPEFPVHVRYTCAGEKTIAATYGNDSVDLALSDGRKLSLPQTLSGSGIRYANADESFVFWSKGKTAFITEGQETSYADCSEAGN